MPLKLVPPKADRTPYWWIRGTYLGCYCERSTGTGDKRLAAQIMRRLERDIERGAVTGPTSHGFAAAAAAYMKAGGDPSFLTPLIKHFGTTPIADIDQVAIDTAARALYPAAAAATLNRQVHTPMSAVLKRAGVLTPIKRPKGWRGKKSTSWLEPEEAFRVFAAADAIEPEFGLLLRMLFYTGMRLGDALAIRLSQVNLQEACIYLPETKNGDPRPVHLPPVLVSALASQPPRKGVTHSVKGRRWQRGEGGRSPTDPGVPFLDRPADAKLFRFHAGGHLRGMLAQALKAAGREFPPRQRGFHLFCHSYGTLMHRYGGLDSYGLARTGRWADPRSADRYRHTQASEEARRADLLPTPQIRGKSL